MAVISNLGRVLVKSQGAWGTAETSFSSTDLISADVFLPTLVQEALVSESFRGSWHAHQVHAGSKEGAEFTIAHVVQGCSATAPSAAPTAHPDTILLRSLLGSANTPGGYLTLAATGQTPTAIAVDTLTSDLAGSAVLVPCSAAATGRTIAWLKTITTAGSPDTATPWFTLPSSATAEGQMYGSYTVHLSTAQPTPFTAQVELQDSNGYAQVRFVDCVCTGATLDVVAGQLQRIAYTCKAGSWTLVNGSDVTVYSNTYPELPPAMGANGAGFPSAPTKPLPAIQVQITSTVQPARSFGGTGGFAKWIVTERDVTMTVTEIIEGTGYASIDAPGTLVSGGLQVDLCTQPGRAVSLLMPTPMHASINTDEDSSGFVVRKSTYKPRQTTEGRGEFAIAFL